MPKVIPLSNRTPMPLRGTYTREISFTEDGTVCMSNNPTPIEALEGGVAQIICIDPDTRS